jgi:hypothetical protein
MNFKRLNVVEIKRLTIVAVGFVLFIAFVSLGMSRYMDFLLARFHGSPAGTFVFVLTMALAVVWWALCLEALVNKIKK